MTEGPEISEDVAPTTVCVCGHTKEEHTEGGVCTSDDLDDPSEPCSCSSFLAKEKQP